MRTSFFYNDSINIFTDTSDKIIKTNTKGDVRATAPGFVVTYQHRIMYQGVDIYLDEYTIFGEMKAIEMAIHWCLSFATTNYRGYYNIFSDSHASVAMINNLLIEWVFHIAHKQTHIAMHNKKDTNMVKQIAYYIFYNIITSGLPIRVFYTPGHIPIYDTSFSAFNKYRNKLVKLNDKYHEDLSHDIDDQAIFEIGTFNNVVDIITRNYLFQYQNFVKHDLDNCGNFMLFGEQKIFPVRWPFVVSNNPQNDTNLIAQQLMLPSPTN